MKRLRRLGCRSCWRIRRRSSYLRARKDRETSAHLPEGTLVAFTGGKDFDDVTAIWRSLDSTKIKYDDTGRFF